MAAEGAPRLQVGDHQHPASMGPRPDGRGRLSHCSTVMSYQISVNGAATGWPRKAKRLYSSARRHGSRQWGRDRMAAEGPCALRRPAPLGGVNGAATGWPRKGRAIAMSGGVSQRVNGAATGWPRKGSLRGCCRRRRPSVNGAATGWPRKVSGSAILGRLSPRQWGRDRMAAEGRAPRRLSAARRGVNGAATGWPRKAGQEHAAFNGAALRQWGRDRMAAEGRHLGVFCSGPARVNGAATGWPRKERWQGRRACRSRRVNGAATGWPRKVDGRFWARDL